MSIKSLKDDVRGYVVGRLQDRVGEDSPAGDLHHHLCNEDYYIIGTYEAKQWLGEHTFDAIGEIQEYEQFNFGGVNTDLSDPEKVANMLAYIYGEEILQESEHLQDNWDSDELTEEDLNTIASEIEGE